MAKRLAIPSHEIKLALVNSRGVNEISRVQSITANLDLPVTDVYEIGNRNQVGTGVDMPNITLGINAFDAGVRLFSALTGTNPDNYPAGGKSINDFVELDALLYIKDPNLSQHVKFGHIKRAAVQDFSLSYNVTGESTENYTLVASEKRWFKRDVIVDRFTTGTNSFVLSNSPLQLKNGNMAISVILDGEYLTETTSTPGSGEYRIIGTTLTTGDNRTDSVVVVYQTNTISSGWSYISDTKQPAVVRGRDVKVVISTSNIDRVQTVTINGAMNIQNVNELGNRNKVGTQKQVPTVNGTITVLDTDTDLIALLLGSHPNDTEYQIEGACTSGSGLNLKIKILDPCDTSAPYTVLKTIVVPNIMVVGDSYTVNVNQNVQQAFNFRSMTGEMIVYSGDF
ncbi:MAG: hypothetical protein ACUVT3_00710 [Ignavibacterium sp.]